MSAPRVRLYPPHLDGRLTATEASEIVASPTSVASHAFFPFLQRNKRWTKFEKRGTERANVREKNREIRYASRRDSYIFAYYRTILNPLYEDELQRLGIDRSVLAYRRIPKDSGRGGKCNIDFAKDAFEVIRNFGDCHVVALDVHKFFENLDHERIKQLWWRILGKPVQRNNNWILPKDHFHVFKAVTKYSYICVDSAYKELKLIDKVTLPTGKAQLKYKFSRDTFPIQICTPEEFRCILLPHIKHNEDGFGIPQGSPISDLLANLYMLDFDKAMNDFVCALKGKYYRYSDDILLILPGANVNWLEISCRVDDILKTTAPRLKLKESKTQVYQYKLLSSLGNQQATILNCENGSDGIEYLGFRYDGKNVYLRNSTISGIQRKITATAKTMASKYAKENPALGLPELTEKFNYSLLISKFGRVKDFDELGKNYAQWTFWTYVKRSTAIFGELGSPILKQFNNYKGFARTRAKRALEENFKRKKTGL